jgi:hypothetical protein
LMILLAKAGTHIHLFIHSPLSRGAKKGKPISQLPLKNLLIFQCLRLT